jgi:hypothetical protein
MSIVKLNNRGIRSATAVGTTTQLGDMVFIKKLTASSSSTLSFVDGASSVVLDDTYKEYLFTFNNIHPGTDDVSFMFNLSIDGGSNYNVTKTSNFFISFQNEAGSQTNLTYSGSYDSAQSTGDEYLTTDTLGADNDQCVSGYLHLFNPSSTTFVKHFIAQVSHYHEADFAVNDFKSGYANTTSAIDAIQFKMDSGNIDAGDICLYGIN